MKTTWARRPERLVVLFQETRGYGTSVQFAASVASRNRRSGVSDKIGHAHPFRNEKNALPTSIAGIGIESKSSLPTSQFVARRNVRVLCTADGPQPGPHRRRRREGLSSSGNHVAPCRRAAHPTSAFIWRHHVGRVTRFVNDVADLLMLPRRVRCVWMSTSPATSTGPEFAQMFEW